MSLSSIFSRHQCGRNYKLVPLIRRYFHGAHGYFSAFVLHPSSPIRSSPLFSLYARRLLNTSTVSTTIKSPQKIKQQEYAPPLTKDEERERDERERKERQRLQYRSAVMGLYLLGGFAIYGVCMVFWIYGRAPADPATGGTGQDQYSHLLPPFAAACRVRDAMSSWVNFIVEPSREKLLPDPVKPPYHQPKFTVVIEMRNVLVNPSWDYRRGHHFVKRPAVDYFMDVIGYPNFELVIYTSDPAMTAESVVAQLDPHGMRINHALFRDNAKLMNNTYVKDLSRLNRDLSKVIYIDWDPKAFQLNTENVLRVPKWEGQSDDTWLVDLAELLKTIHLSDVEDVRPILQFYSQFDNPMMEFRARAKGLNQQHSLSISEPDVKQEAGGEPAKKYRGNLFGMRRHSI